MKLPIETRTNKRGNSEKNPKKAIPAADSGDRNLPNRSMVRLITRKVIFTLGFLSRNEILNDHLIRTMNYHLSSNKTFSKGGDLGFIKKSGQRREITLSIPDPSGVVNYQFVQPHPDFFAKLARLDGAVLRKFDSLFGILDNEHHNGSISHQ
jgi:hypothetical protein